MLLACLCIGCASSDKPPDEEMAIDAVEVIDFADRPDELVAYTKLRTEGTPKGEAVAVPLHADYAICMLWPLDTQTLEPTGGPRRLYVYDRVRGRVVSTADFDAFLDALGSIPTGSTVERIECCSAPFSHGMPPAARRRLESAMTERRLAWYVDFNDHPYTIECICAFGDLRFPDGRVW